MALLQCVFAMLVLGFSTAIRAMRSVERAVEMTAVQSSDVSAGNDAGAIERALVIGTESFPVRGSKTPMPARGFITCCNGTITTATMLSSLVAYLKAGGRLIDTAPEYAYQESSYQDVVGEAVRMSGVPRKEIWLSSKVDTEKWTPGKGDPKAWALQQVEQILHAMQVSYIDIVTLHAGPAQVAQQVAKPTRGSSGHMGPAEHTEMWRGLIEAKRAGKILNIGICETTKSEIENLISQTGETPAVLLTWYNPWTPSVQEDYIDWARSKDITVVAYGLFNWKYQPLASVARPGFTASAAIEASSKAGKRHGVTPGQICIQWLLEQKIGFITGMYHPQYLVEDLAELDFSLDHEDHALLLSVPVKPCEAFKPFQVMPGCFP